MRPSKSGVKRPLLSFMKMRVTLKDRFAKLQIMVCERIQERLDAKVIKAKNFRVYM